jgi:RNA polymerase sigma-70 factor (ECF subfamily)
MEKPAVPAAPVVSDQDPAAVLRRRMSALLKKVAADADRAAFTELFDHFAPRVKAYLMRLGAPGPQAEDLAQDVLVTVWRKAALFDDRQASASTWIFTIARNRRIDSIRRARRPEIDPNDPLFVPDPEPQADAVLVTAEREDRLRAAMAKLTADQRALLAQAFYDGKSHSEIAAATSLPLGTVKSRLRNIFAKLRGMLSEL